jgi:hypothetical protein
MVPGKGIGARDEMFAMIAAGAKKCHGTFSSLDRQVAFKADIPDDGHDVGETGFPQHVEIVLVGEGL